MLHTSVKIRDAHPDYAAAKSGDAEAAAHLSYDLLDRQKILFVKEFIARLERPSLLPIHAEEQNGFNAIPLGMSDVLSRLLQVPTNDSVYQSNIVSHTRADGFGRIARQATFTGRVAPGAQYIVVDDHFGMGGTIANLRGFVMSRGATVGLATTLTASRANDIIAIQRITLETLVDKFGSGLDEYLEEKFGFGVKCLTEPEAGYLARATSLDQIRARIASAESG
ncbi:MAG: hypothetical protein SFV21_14255 [Rhodospirillaceae bacterium]|nr:hypothetical protein [Rhodospirillaceae bacterium]